MYILFWIAAMVIFAVIETMSLTIICIWFIAGSLGGLIAALMNFSFSVQLFVFIIISGASLYWARPFFMDRMRSGLPYEKTNLDLMLESQGVAIEGIDNVKQTGAVKICGKVWTARSADNSLIPEGALVKPVSVEGVKLMVLEVKASEPEINT